MKTKLHFFVFVACSIFSRAQSPCYNMDFEAMAPGSYAGSSNSLAITGWTISSQTVSQCSQSPSYVGGASEISMVQTPITNIPLIGTIPQSPLGGTVVASLNYSLNNSSATRISRTYNVAAANSLFQFAHAGYYDSGGHQCCEQPKFMVEIRDTLGNVLNCITTDYSSCNAGTSFSVTSSVSWNNWLVESVDLSPLIGSKVIINIISQDCIYGGHTGFTFFDARCSSASASFNCACNQVAPFSPVSFCAGAGIASIQGPFGYQTYSWTAPSGFSIPAGQETLSAITFSNPVAGAVFTLNFSKSNCQFAIRYTLATSTVNISGLGILPPCNNSANGSATVVANGSASGYSYLWTNSTGSVISTSSIATNIAPGSYTAQITSSGCGTASLPVNVTNGQTKVTNLIKPYCSGENAYLQINGGSNYQWYGNSTIISGANNYSYAVTTPTQGAVYWLGYNNNQGCRDSIKYILTATSPGSFNVTTPTVCQGLTNGTAVITMTQAMNTVPGYNGYFAYSTSTSMPAYNSSVTGSPFTTFTISNLAAGGTYSIIGFDGSCYYSKVITVTIFAPIDYTIAPGTKTVCSGNILPAAINFQTNTPGAYTYSWMPNIFLAGNSNTVQNTIITPTVAPGGLATIIYSVTVTPTSINCPETKTLSIIVANPLTPTISAIPSMCSNAAPFLVNVIPQGGYFSGTGAISQQGMLTPSKANVGNNTLIYTNGVGTCIATSSASFIIVASPTAAINGNLFVCSPASTTLTASGASAYTWNTGHTGSNIILSPATSTLIIVTANNGNCTDSASAFVQVAPMPNVSISGNTAVCAGTQATLQAAGANSYLWNNGSTTNPNIVNPAQTTMYSVWGSNSSFCKDSAVILVNVTPVPVLQISGNFSLCPGESSLLVATGATSYFWNTGATSGIIGVMPAQTTMYTVTGTNLPANCSSTRSITVNVDACLGINEQNEISGTIVYPNPVTHALTIEKNENSVVKIYNELGILIFEKNVEKGKNTISTNQWVPGIYFVRISDDLNTRTYRIVKAE